MALSLFATVCWRMAVFPLHRSEAAVALEQAAKMAVVVVADGVGDFLAA